MDVDLELKLEERRADRVLVSVAITPTRPGEVELLGVNVELQDAAGEALCPQTLLPISGAVNGPLSMSVELRVLRPLPAGARVQATAWGRHDQVVASCPADPYCRLRDHLRGARLGLPDDEDVLLEVLDATGLAALEAWMPFVAEALRPPSGNQAVIEALEEPTAEEIAEELGLDDECAAWLKDLLDEDEDEDEDALI